jgi:integrase
MGISGDGLYAAYVLLLVLGLRKGELLGLTWEMVSFNAAELYVGEQLQRVGRELLRRPAKTEGSEAPLALPLPDLCVTALKLRRQQQDTARQQAGDRWADTGLVFTTRFGTPIEPRNFTAASTGASARRESAGSPSMAPASPAGRCWPRSTSTRVWPCRSCGTARSPSRWRSTPRSCPRRPAKRFAS